MESTREILKIRGSQEREIKVTVHRENVYPYNLVGFKEKVDTFMRIKGRLNLLCQVY